MKFICKIMFSLLVLSTFASCDQGFEEMNKSQDLVLEPTLDYMIPTIQLNLYEKSYYTHYTMLGILSQQIQGSNIDSYSTQKTAMSHLFDDIYPKTIKNVVDVIEKTKGQPDLINYWAMATIMRAYEISRLTDAYGDIPYSEAGLGYLKDIIYPKYDRQEDIYAGICGELEKAADSFDKSKKNVPAASDIVYGSDYDKWKRFSNSLLLRFGMRMTKVAPDKAKVLVQKAISRGTMKDNEDSFIVYYLPDTYYSTTANGNAAANKYDYKLTDVFVDLLKTTRDPRLSIYAMLPSGDNAPEVQRGFLLFQSDKTSKSIVSTPNTSTYARFDAPYVHMSYAEVCFLRSEAALRQWSEDNAGDEFYQGIRAHLEMQVIYGDKATLGQAAIDNYISGIAFDDNNFNEAFKAIHTQMWIALYYNWNEAFSNWRRTGIPSFNDAISKRINRRLLYPQSEWNTNTDNVREAVARQGADNVMTQMWWDKE